MLAQKEPAEAHYLMDQIEEGVHRTITTRPSLKNLAGALSAQSAAVKLLPVRQTVRTLEHSGYQDGSAAFFKNPAGFRPAKAVEQDVQSAHAPILKCCGWEACRMELLRTRIRALPRNCLSW